MRFGLTSCLLALLLTVTPPQETAYAQADAGASQPDPIEALRSVPTAKPERPYHPPTQKQRFRRYAGWMFSPYSWASVTFVSGLHQAERNPPDWEEGWAGFGQRYASNLGTNMGNATARYVLAEVLKEDTLYYPCRCRRPWPRLQHAVLTSFLARRGADGHQVLGLPQIVAPYAGPFLSVYAWYPSRYNAEDAMRMGLHGLMSEVGTNVAIEFLPSILNRWGRRWEKRLHLHIPSGAGAPR